MVTCHFVINDFESRTTNLSYHFCIHPSDNDDDEESAMNYMDKKQRVYIRQQQQQLLIIFVVFCYSVFVNCIPPVHSHHRLAYQRGTISFRSSPPPHRTVVADCTTTRRFRSRTLHQYPYYQLPPVHSSIIKSFMSSSSHTNNDGDDGQPIEPDATKKTSSTTTSSSSTTETVATTSMNITSNPDAITAAFEFANLVGQLKITPRTGWIRRNIVPCESVADHSWRVAILAFLLLSPSETNPRQYNDTIPKNNNNNNSNNSVCNDFDIAKVIQMALIHDVAECIVGDITPEDNVSKYDKHQLEYNAMRQITQLLHAATTSNTTNQNGTDDSNRSSKAASSISNLDDNLLMKLFQEYEERHSLESIIVKDLDLLDMILQANTYELQYAWKNHPEHSSRIDLSDFFTGTPPSRFQIPQIRQIAEYIHQQRNDRIYHHHHHHMIHNDKISPPSENELGNTDDHVFQSNSDSAHVDPSSSNDDDINMILLLLSKSDLAFIEEYSQTIPQHPSPSITTTTSTRDIVAATVRALRQWDQTNHKSVEEEP